MRICVITYNCKVVVGPGAQLCTLLEVWVLGVGMSTLDAQTACTPRIGGSKYRWPWSMATLTGPYFPSIETRQLGRGFQIGMFRPIRLDHTNCLQVDIKTHSFRKRGLRGEESRRCRCYERRRPKVEEIVVSHTLGCVVGSSVVRWVPLVESVGSSVGVPSGLQPTDPNLQKNKKKWHPLGKGGKEEGGEG